LRIRSFAVALVVVTKAYVRAAVNNNRLTVVPATNIGTLTPASEEA
jgi:hypothetical protein